MLLYEIVVNESQRLNSQYEILAAPIGLAVLDVTPYHLSDDGELSYIITRINVPDKHRGKGLGRELLRRCIAEADDKKLTLFLEINSYGPLNNEALYNWYCRNGFSGEVGGVLKRSPKT